MSVKGRPIKAATREKIRESQIARWQRIRQLMAQGEQHEAECEDDQHVIDNSHPRNCKHDHECKEPSLLDKVAMFITNLK